MILRYFYSLLKGLNMLTEDARRMLAEDTRRKQNAEAESLGALALSVSQIRQDLDQWLPGIKAMLAQVHAAVHALSEDREAAVKEEHVKEAIKGNPLGLPPDWNVKCLEEQMGALIKQVDQLDVRLTALEQLKTVSAMSSMSDRIRVVENKIGRVDRFVGQLGNITK